MKKELNLTDKEKIEFLAGLEYSNIAYDIIKIGQKPLVRLVLPEL